MNIGPPDEPSRTRAVLISIGVLAAIAAAVFLLNPHKTAEASVTQTQLFAAHTQTKAAPSTSGFKVLNAPDENQDDLYVFATVSLTDKLRIPIFINSVTAEVTLPAGLVQTDVLHPADMQNLYLSFPAAKANDAPQLQRDAAIAPGETATGIVVLHINGATEGTWNSRRSATLTIDLAHQSSITLTIP